MLPRLPPLWGNNSAGSARNFNIPPGPDLAPVSSNDLWGLS
jgi:hypothetical protein